MGQPFFGGGWQVIRGEQQRQVTTGSCCLLMSKVGVSKASACGGSWVVTLLPLAAEPWVIFSRLLTPPPPRAPLFLYTYRQGSAHSCRQEATEGAERGGHCCCSALQTHLSPACSPPPPNTHTLPPCTQVPARRHSLGQTRNDSRLRERLTLLLLRGRAWQGRGLALSLHQGMSSSCWRRPMTVTCGSNIWPSS